MKKAFFAACAVSVLLLFSCTAVPPQKVTDTPIRPMPPPERPRPERPQPEQPRPERPQPEQPRPERPQPERPRPEQPRPEQPRPERPQPEQPRPERPRPPELIMGNGRSTRENLAAFLLIHNPAAGNEFVRFLSGYYIEEAAAEGVNHDVAFAQMCLETGFLRYGGLVIPEMNNFCGLGAIGPEQPGLAFPDARTGVRAHIQHLKAYASEEPLNGVLVDPRYRYVKQGSSPGIYGLAGTWAADKAYGEKIAHILNRLYNFLD